MNVDALQARDESIAGRIGPFEGERRTTSLPQGPATRLPLPCLIISRAAATKETATQDDWTERLKAEK
jgi:hypothetical protein